MPGKDEYTILDNPQRWKLAMEINNIGFYDWYPLNDTIYWDKNLHRMNGLDPKRKVDRMKHFLSIVHPEDKEQVRLNMVEVLDPENSSDHFDHHFRSILHGGIRYLRSSGIRIRDKSGQIKAVFGMVVDNTSKVETQERIWENEERLRIAAEASGFGTFDYIVKENKLYWDKRMHQIFGLKESSKVNRIDYFFKKIHPGDLERVSANYQRVMGSDSNEMDAHDEFRIIVKGEVKYLMSHGTLIREKEGNIIRSTGTIFDITELKKTQKQLEESQEYFRSIFEGNTDYISTVDRNKKIVFINHVMSGLSKEEIAGKSILEFSEPQDRNMIDKKIDQVLNRGKNEQFETSIEGPKGRIFFSTRVSPLIKKGKIFGATFIARDITKAKESEQKLLKQAIELQRINQNLEQFAYVSSHDVKAPITNLQSLVSMMDDPDMFSTEAYPIFERIKETVKQMNQTVHSLNEVFSIQSNLNLPKEKLNLEKILEQTLNSINNQIVESDARISFDFKEAPKIHFPKIHLISIFQNLVTNSIKYKQVDKVPRIKISSKKIPNSSRIKLIVRDNGRGMDLKTYGNKVFGLFQRFHLDIEGKGMGLHIIKMIIESYGGEISLKSSPNKGTVFTLLFD